jgi:hypothetical protein
LPSIWRKWYETAPCVQVVAQIITAYQTNGGDLTKAFAPFAAAQKKLWWTLAIPADLPHDERQQWVDGNSCVPAPFFSSLCSSKACVD